jgi:mannose-6-phosphate isomerase-like protein (cupin superfamily)
MLMEDPEPVVGPRSTYRAPDEGIAAPADYPGAPVSRILDDATPGAEMFAVLVAITGDIPLHYHPVMELQYVLSGHGLALDADGGETPIGPGGTVISPAGPSGAHGFRNTGPLPLTLLCVYPAPGGVAPGRMPFSLPAVSRSQAADSRA